MQTFAELSDTSRTTLRWVKSAHARGVSELRAGDALLATLTWGRGSSAEAEWPGAHYRLSRQGWFRQRVVVHDAMSDTSEEVPYATFTAHGGTLALSDGRVFRWQKPKRWTSDQVWVDGAANVLMRFHPGRKQTEIEVLAPPAEPLPELLLLLVLGQYLLVLAAQDAAAVAATTAAVVVSTGGA